MNIRLEKIRTEDVTGINRILKLAFRESHEKYRYCPAYEVSDGDLAVFLDRSDAYKILTDDSLVGAVFICKTDDNQYELNTLAIHPDCQNKGFGSRAISLAESLYPGDACWSLQTPEKDANNRHLYEKHGYLNTGSEVINEYLTLINYRKQRKENL